MRLRLDYYDHNEDFASLLPRDGQVARFLLAGDDSKWALFQLETALVYDGLSYDKLLLRSRWKGQEIGGAEPTSVFILLVNDATGPSDGFAVEAYRHVAWGMASTLP